MKQPLPDRDDLLTRDEAAVALTSAGYPIRSATLGTKATRGGGPPFCRFGTRSLYRWGEALDWAKGRLASSRGPAASESRDATSSDDCPRADGFDPSTFTPRREDACAA
jgi:hypothetical protein